MDSQLNRVGKYMLQGVLARTALSTVHAAWDCDIARHVAIKMMPLAAMDHADDREVYLRFRRGARAAGKLNHPNIVGVYDYGEADAHAYLVMELIEGPTLKTVLDSGKRFSLTEIRVVMAGILAALQYSHDNGVVHRDVKPANIMFTKDDRVKLTDFGIARMEDSDMTQAGTVIGTPAYMAPEQLCAETIDARTDVYAAGVVLYQLLTGERPYDGTLATIMHKVLYGSPPLPSRLSPLASPVLDRIVTRAMARKPGDRFDSASEFNDALRSVLTPPIPRMTPSVTDRLAAIRQIRARPPRRAALFAGLAIFLSAAISSSVWYETSHRPSALPPPRAEEAQATPPSPPSVLASTPPEAAPPALPPPDPPPIDPTLTEVPALALPPPDVANPVRPPPADLKITPRPPQTAAAPAKPAGRTALASNEADAVLARLRGPQAEPASQAANLSPPAATYAIVSTSPVGLVCQSITTETAGRYGLPTPRGMVVTGVAAGSAAAKAGIRTDDVILKIDGEEANDLAVLRGITERAPSGQTVPVELYRNRATRVVQLQVSQPRP